jgi:hypothetical protein
MTDHFSNSKNSGKALSFISVHLIYSYVMNAVKRIFKVCQKIEETWEYSEYCALICREWFMKRSDPQSDLFDYGVNVLLMVITSAGHHKPCATARLGCKIDSLCRACTVRASECLSALQYYSNQPRY